jgi:hypothetical protein
VNVAAQWRLDSAESRLPSSDSDSRFQKHKGAVAQELSMMLLAGSLKTSYRKKNRVRCAESELVLPSQVSGKQLKYCSSRPLRSGGRSVCIGNRLIFVPSVC